MRARAVTFIIVRLDARQRLLVLLRVHEQLKKELRKGSPNAQIPWLTVSFGEGDLQRSIHISSSSSGTSASVAQAEIANPN
jgi:hypothetical protein